MKSIIKKAIGDRGFKSLVSFYLWFRNVYLMVTNFSADFILFYKYSCVFRKSTLSKIEAQIILDYHSLEKGFLFIVSKPRFGINRVKTLHENLGKKIIKDNIELSQIQVGYKIMCKYYEVHVENKIDISDYFTARQYNTYKDLLLAQKEYKVDFSAVYNFSREEFYKETEQDFLAFSNSRRSVRNFTGNRIPVEVIQKALTLVGNSPSVCNRQSSKAYLIEDKFKIDRILKIQGGFTGYTENVSQLLIVTADRSYFYSVGERNQFYIDGGIFLMNLLYSLHFYNIGNCPANWGKTVQEERACLKYLQLDPSEKIICTIPIGEVEENFRTCLSKRREVSEYFKII